MSVGTSWLITAWPEAVTAALLVAALLRDPSRRRAPWLLLLLSLGLVSVGRSIEGGAVHLGLGNRGVETGEALCLLAGAALTLALGAFHRLQGRRVDPRLAVDALLLSSCLTLGVVLVAVVPRLESTTASDIVPASLLPALALGLLSLVLTFAAQQRLHPAMTVLTLGTTPWILGVVATTAWQTPAWVLPSFLSVTYLCWIALAWHPHGRTLTEPVPVTVEEPPIVRQVSLLAGGGLLGALGLMVSERHPGLTLVGITVFTTLVVRCLVLANSIRDAYELQLRDARSERALGELALRFVEAETAAAVHRTAVDGARELLLELPGTAVALAAGPLDDLQIVALSGDLAHAGSLDVEGVLRTNRELLTSGDPLPTRCGRGVLVPVVGRTGTLGVLAVLAPGANLTPWLGLLASVARQTAVALESLVAVERSGSLELRSAPQPFVLAMQGALPGERSVTDLHRGMRAGEIRAVFQPVVRLRDGAVVGYEALARWEHPERGLVLPDRFLGTAVDSGLMVPLGRQLLTQVVTTAARLPLGVGELSVAVNLCAAELRAPGLMDVLRTLLVANDLPAQRLVVEVTENTVLEDVRMISEVLDDLRSIGIKVHLDDFGTGYSSLSWLKELPLDGIKIDRSFVTPAPDHRQGPAVVEGILRMSEVLRLTVVAEGVESTEQSRHLAAMGCEYGQGWALGMPGPLDRHRVEQVLGRPGSAEPVETVETVEG